MNGAFKWLGLTWTYELQQMGSNENTKASKDDHENYVSSFSAEGFFLLNNFICKDTETIYPISV